MAKLQERGRNILTLKWREGKFTNREERADTKETELQRVTTAVDFPRVLAPRELFALAGCGSRQRPYLPSRRSEPPGATAWGPKELGGESRDPGPDRSGSPGCAPHIWAVRKATFSLQNIKIFSHLLCVIVFVSLKL